MPYQNRQQRQIYRNNGKGFSGEQFVSEQDPFGMPNSLMISMPMAASGVPNSVMREMEAEDSGGSYRSRGFSRAAGAYMPAHTDREKPIPGPVSLSAPTGTVQRTSSEEDDEHYQDLKDEEGSMAPSVPDTEAPGREDAGGAEQAPEDSLEEIFTRTQFLWSKFSDRYISQALEAYQSQNAPAAETQLKVEELRLVPRTLALIEDYCLKCQEGQPQKFNRHISILLSKLERIQRDADEAISHDAEIEGEANSFNAVPTKKQMEEREKQEKEAAKQQKEQNKKPSWLRRLLSLREDKKLMEVGSGAKISAAPSGKKLAAIFDTSSATVTSKR